jgi:hypothetical protein
MTRYLWNERAGRYRGSNGRFVSGKEVRASLDRSVEASSKRMKELSIALKESRINISEWQVKMYEELKSAHIASAAAARGGFAQLTQSDLGRIGSIIKDELKFLRRFGLQIENGETLLDGRFLQRAQMYIEASRETYHIFLALEVSSRGYQFEESKLHPADHCTTGISCVGEAAKGRVEIGGTAVIGGRTCRTKCKCSKNYFKTMEKSEVAFAA